MTNMDLDQIESNYIRILEAGQQDVLASLETKNPKDFFAALERHKALTESVKNGVDAYTTITALYLHSKNGARLAHKHKRRLTSSALH